MAQIAREHRSAQSGGLLNTIPSGNRQDVPSLCSRVTNHPAPAGSGGHGAMGNAADIKGPGPFGCLLMALFLGYILWQFAGCFERDPPPDPEAEYAEAMERLRSPSVYVAVSRFIERRGHACPIIREIRPADRFAAADIIKTDRPVEILVTCDADGPVSVYAVEMSRDNRFGSVTLHTE